MTNKYPQSDPDDRPHVSYSSVGRYSRCNSECSIASEHLQIYELAEDSRYNTLSSATLTWRDLHVCTARAKKRSFLSCGQSSQKYHSKDIIKRVSGIVEPGQFVAILGASGAGKTTLLNTLAQRSDDRLDVAGSIQVNGWPIESSQMSLVSAYVEQEDNFMSSLTVKETLLFHAMLRMDQSFTHKRRLQKVNAVMKNLGLFKCADTMIGNPIFGIKGISGGERKRLSVAVELLMDPPLIFLDEPTSGLDAFMAENVIKLISKLAKANRTILMTIHQPSSEVFALFDKVCLLADGHITYLGDRELAVQHFENFGKPCPERFNPADHFIFELAIRPNKEEECLSRIEAYTQYYKQSSGYKVMEERINDVTKTFTTPPSIISRRSLQASVATQFNENMKRVWYDATRNPRLTKQRILESILWGLLQGLAFFFIRNDQNVAQNKGGLLFFFATSFTFNYVYVQASTIPLVFPIIHREYRVGMYGVASYLLSLIVSFMPTLFALPMLQLLLGYFLTGLRRDPISFLVCYVICVSMAWVASGLGLFASAVAPDIGTANAIVAPLIMPFLLFGGLYQNEEDTPYWFYPVKFLSWIRYGWTSLMINEFVDLPIECNSKTKNFTQKDCIYKNGNEILRVYGIDSGTLWWPNIASNVLLGVGLCLISMFFLWRRVIK